MTIQRIIDAKTKLDKFRLEKKDNPLLESIHIQLNYLLQLLENPNSDRSKLKDINIGLIAVREIEGIDDKLAERLYEINYWVDKDLLNK